MANVLIGYSACPLTRLAFEAHGHNVWTCDLLPARDNSPKHFQCDVWEVLGMDWGMAVLHPMCTYLTVSAAWAFKEPDYIKYPGVGYHQRVQPGTLTGGRRCVARTEALINFKRLLALPFPVAIENPATSFINKAIRPPDQIVHPWMFGDDASKATGFWLTRGAPELVHFAKHACKPRIVNGRMRWANQTDSGQNNLSTGENRWLERSKTWPGVAAAMGDQWGRWLSERPE